MYPTKKQYGQAYRQMNYLTWIQAYDSCQVSQYIQSFSFDRIYPDRFSFSARESLILQVLAARATTGECLSPSRIASLQGGRKQNVRLILQRLGLAQILVNLGTLKRQNLRINGMIIEWDFKTLIQLRNAENMRIIDKSEKWKESGILRNKKSNRILYLVKK